MLEVVGSVVSLHLLVKPGSYIVPNALGWVEARPHGSSVEEPYL
jgi:hypothetical protein